MFDLDSGAVSNRDADLKKGVIPEGTAKSLVEMDVQAYLSRIGFSGQVEPSLDVLRSLHTCHLMSVPFEDLTIHSGGRVQIDIPILYDKIVNQRRGGFCLENNGLFSWLLDKVGFRVTLLSAQYRNKSHGFYGPPYDHLTLMVSLDGQRWLCDIGVGAVGFYVPLSLDTSGPQEQGHRVYRIRQSAEMLFLELKNRVDEQWAEVYKFTLEPRRLEDFAEMCQYHQSSPHSVFVCKSLCTIFKPGGRVTYVGRKLTSVTFPEEPGGELKTTTREIEDEELPGILAEEFGIVLKSPLIPKDETPIPPPVMY